MSNWLANLKLQSPLWQGIGAVVSIVALLVSTFITYDIYQKSAQFSELTIERVSSFNPIYFGEDARKRVAMIVNEEIVSDVRVYYYSLRNTGKVPIVPSDFIEPIKVSAKKPFRILTVEKEESDPKNLSISWKKVDESSFQIKPLLLNPGDFFYTLVFVSDSSMKISDTQVEAKGNKTSDQVNKNTDENASPQERKLMPEPSWEARIVNIQKLKFTTPQAGRETERKSLGLFYATFYHAGWSVYRFAAFTSLLFVFGLFCGVQFGILQKVSFVYYLLLSVLTGLSVISGETLASRLQSGMAPGEFWISNLGLILYMLLIVFFTFPAVKKVFHKNLSPNNPDQSTTGGNNSNS